MRAKAVNEVNFERNLDPRTSLGLGLFPKDPMPKFLEAVENLRNNPEEASFLNFKNLFNDTAEDLIVITIRDGLQKIFNCRVEVKPKENSWEDPTIRMYLPSGEHITIFPSSSRIHWEITLFKNNDENSSIGSAGSASTFGTLVKRIKKLLKDNNIKIGQ